MVAALVVSRIVYTAFGEIRGETLAVFNVSFGERLQTGHNALEAERQREAEEQRIAEEARLAAEAEAKRQAEEAARQAEEARKAAEQEAVAAASAAPQPATAPAAAPVVPPTVPADPTSVEQPKKKEEQHRRKAAPTRDDDSERNRNKRAGGAKGRNAPRVSDDDEALARRRGGGGKLKAHKKRNQHGFEKPTGPVVREVVIGETVTVAELAQKMSVKAAEVIKYMFKNGNMVTINQVLDQDTATIVAEDMGHELSGRSADAIRESYSTPADEIDWDQYREALQSTLN